MEDLERRKDPHPGFRREGELESRIRELEGMLTERGIPLPPPLPTPEVSPDPYVIAGYSDDRDHAEHIVEPAPLPTPEVFPVGQLVRITSTVHRGNDPYLGRLAVIRAYSTKHPQLEVRVDDGDPGDPDMKTNGWTFGLWTSLGCLTKVGALLLIAGCGSVDCSSEDPGASGVFHVRHYDGIRYTFTEEYLAYRGWDGMTVYAAPAALEVDAKGRPLWTCPVVDGVQVYDTIELWEK